MEKPKTRKVVRLELSESGRNFLVKLLGRVDLKGAEAYLFLQVASSIERAKVEELTDDAQSTIE